MDGSRARKTCHRRSRLLAGENGDKESNDDAMVSMVSPDSLRGIRSERDCRRAAMRRASREGREVLSPLLPPPWRSWREASTRCLHERLARTLAPPFPPGDPDDSHVAIVSGSSSASAW